jgi:predicted small lipoprotein YifL
MFSKEQVFCLLLAALMIVTLTACGKRTDTTKPSDSNQTAEQSPTQGTDNSQGNNNSETGEDQSDDEMIVPAKLTGSLNLIEMDDRDSSILRGVRINGNSVGTQDDINGKESSLTDVRCIFDLNEWIEFYPDSDAEYYLRVWILKHRDDHEYYKTCKFSDLMPEYVTYCDLHYPVDEEKPEEWYWGSFYLNPDECEPGYYDFVFTYEGKAIATLVTKFYKEGDIDGKSGTELEALMHEQ